jgi:hypothetical protein
MTGFIERFDTARDYYLQFTITHTRTHTIVQSYVSTWRCRVTASKGWRSPSSGFPNCPRAWATSFSQQQQQSSNSLTNQVTPLQYHYVIVLFITSRYGSLRKHFLLMLFNCFLADNLENNTPLSLSAGRCLATAAVLPPISRPSSRNGSTCRNIVRN